MPPSAEDGDPFADAEHCVEPGRDVNDGDATRGEYQKQAAITYATGTTPDWASWEALGTDDGKILDRINLV